MAGSPLNIFIDDVIILDCCWGPVGVPMFNLNT